MTLPQPPPQFSVVAASVLATLLAKTVVPSGRLWVHFSRHWRCTLMHPLLWILVLRSGHRCGTAHIYTARRQQTRCSQTSGLTLGTLPPKPHRSIFAAQIMVLWSTFLASRGKHLEVSCRDVARYMEKTSQRLAPVAGRDDHCADCRSTLSTSLHFPHNSNLIP